MTAGVRPRVVGAEPGSVFPTSIPLPRGQPGAEHTGSQPSGPLQCSCLLRHLELGEVMLGAEDHQPLQPLTGPSSHRSGSSFVTREQYGNSC